MLICLNGSGSTDSWNLNNTCSRAVFYMSHVKVKYEKAAYERTEICNHKSWI
jgi:hypothetical protein